MLPLFGREQSDSNHINYVAQREFGSFDIMFNNAGVSLETPFGFPFATPSPVWRKLIDINLTAVIEGTQLACQEFKKGGKGGVVINTASMGGILPMIDSPIYAASKVLSSILLIINVSFCRRQLYILVGLLYI